MTKNLDILVFSLVTTAMAVGWYHLYVKPNDERRKIIVECMYKIDDMSIKGYQQCENLLSKGPR